LLVLLDVVVDPVVELELEEVLLPELDKLDLEELVGVDVSLLASDLEDERESEILSSLVLLVLDVTDEVVDAFVDIADEIEDEVVDLLADVADEAEVSFCID